jgi:hypothetical protein
MRRLMKPSLSSDTERPSFLAARSSAAFSSGFSLMLVRIVRAMITLARTCKTQGTGSSDAIARTKFELRRIAPLGTVKPVAPPQLARNGSRMTVDKHHTEK